MIFYAVTVNGPRLRKRMYLRGGARMYTTSLHDAAQFGTQADADRAAVDLRRLLALLPSSDYGVGAVQVSRRGASSKQVER